MQGTHQGLADELGTVRKIVTPLLKRFKRAGWVAIGRDRVQILDAAALRGLAPGQATDQESVGLWPARNSSNCLDDPGHRPPAWTLAQWALSAIGRNHWRAP